MAATPWLPAYLNHDGNRGTASITHTGPGTYIIRDGKKLVYVGHSKTDVKKTLYRHFQLWTDRRSADAKKYTGYDRVTYAGDDVSRYSVKVFYTDSGKDAEVLEQLLIQRIKPRDNKAKLMLFTASQYSAMAEAADEPAIIFETPDQEDWQPF